MVSVFVSSSSELNLNQFSSHLKRSGVLYIVEIVSSPSSRRGGGFDLCIYGNCLFVSKFIGFCKRFWSGRPHEFLSLSIFSYSSVEEVQIC